METECPVLAKVRQTTERAVVTRRFKGGPGTAAQLSTVRLRSADRLARARKQRGNILWLRVFSQPISRGLLNKRPGSEMFSDR